MLQDHLFTLTSLQGLMREAMCKLRIGNEADACCHRSLDEVADERGWLVLAHHGGGLVAHADHLRVLHAGHPSRLQPLHRHLLLFNGKCLALKGQRAPSSLLILLRRGQVLNRQLQQIVLDAVDEDAHITAWR